MLTMHKANFIPNAGLYRLVLNLHRDSSGQLPWRDANRVSPPFIVEQ